MLRITEVKNDNCRVTLQLEGKITSDWVKELISEFYKNFDSKTIVAIDLSRVSYVDQQGIYALKALKSENVKLINCSLFLSALLKDLLENQQDSCEATTCF